MPGMTTERTRTITEKTITAMWCGDLAREPKKPTVDGEPSYEQILQGRMTGHRATGRQKIPEDMLTGLSLQEALAILSATTPLCSST